MTKWRRRWTACASVPGPTEGTSNCWGSTTPGWSHPGPRHVRQGGGLDRDAGAGRRGRNPGCCAGGHSNRNRSAAAIGARMAQSSRSASGLTRAERTAAWLPTPRAGQPGARRDRRVPEGRARSFRGVPFGRFRKTWGLIGTTASACGENLAGAMLQRRPGDSAANSEVLVRPHCRARYDARRAGAGLDGDRRISSRRRCGGRCSSTCRPYRAASAGRVVPSQPAGAHRARRRCRPAAPGPCVCYMDRNRARRPIRTCRPATCVPSRSPVITGTWPISRPRQADARHRRAAKLVVHLEAANHGYRAVLLPLSVSTSNSTTPAGSPTIPVGLAFSSSVLRRVVAFYPGPAGVTESELGLAVLTCSRPTPSSALRDDVEHSLAGSIRSPSALLADARGDHGISLPRLRRAAGAVVPEVSTRTDLAFRIDDVVSEPYAAVPQLTAHLEISERSG